MKRHPSRYQRSRRRGYRAPKGAVYVGRPTRWGNPYRPEDYNDGAAGAVSDFEDALRAGHLDITIADVRRELRGKDLLCWCPLDSVCHADALLLIANGPDEESQVRP